MSACELGEGGRGVKAPRHVSVIYSGRDRLELADPFLEVGHVDAIADRGVGDRLARAAELRPFEVEPAFPAPRGDAGDDGEAQKRARGNHDHTFIYEP